MLFNWKLFPGTNLQDLNLDWIINFVKMIPSRLPKFSDHHTWLVYDYSTGEYYDSGEPTGGAGEPGEPGKSPIIGTNGNWYTWNTETKTYTDTGTRAQGVQGEPGAGVASGGVAGDVLVKASGVDYNTGWTATPPQMASIAHINAGNTADQLYNQNDYLVYNGRLYRAKENISQDVLLVPGDSGNIEEISCADLIKTLNDMYTSGAGTIYDASKFNDSTHVYYYKIGRFVCVYGGINIRDTIPSGTAIIRNLPSSADVTPLVGRGLNTTYANPNQDQGRDYTYYVLGGNIQTRTELTSGSWIQFTTCYIA